MPSKPGPDSTYSMELLGIDQLMLKLQESKHRTMVIGDFNGDLWRSHRKSFDQIGTLADWLEYKGIIKSYEHDKILTQWIQKSNLINVSLLYK